MAEQGVTTFDQQTGASGFKERFATGEHPLTDIRILKPGVRYLATATEHLMRRAAAKVARGHNDFSSRRGPVLETDPSSLSRKPNGNPGNRYPSDGQASVPDDRNVSPELAAGKSSGQAASDD